MEICSDDSDNDEVTDFLDSNCNTNYVATTSNHNSTIVPSNKINKQTCTSKVNPANNNNNNMIPIINVTPHSPASVTKYNNLFEDTLSQLQNIRESVVQMKNSSSHHVYDGLSNYGLLQAAILSASLPDLNAAGAIGATGGMHIMAWSPKQQQFLNADRRKSWTAIDDLTAGGGDTNKSVSLSSLDSEEQETIRVTEQRRRAARNSTGGISTHSLNEAELARDFERIAAKRNLATEIISRIPLQKSISTSSIVAKEDIKTIARHLTDSEDENQSLLRAHAKIEVYDNVEKRRKRGSLFFRKKKDKAAKMKASVVVVSNAGGGVQSLSCDSCGNTITQSNIKEHQLECSKGGKGKSSVLSSVKKLSAGDAAAGQDFYDGPVDAGAGGFNEDAAPLIRSEFLNEPQIEARDLGAESCLGIALEEHDSWSPSVPKEILKSLDEKQVKRQEHIYEFIMTEKHHCQTLLVMQKVFVESLERYFPALNVTKMFPRLLELTDLHTTFLKKLRQKQREQYIVDSIADILLDFFSLEKAQNLRLAYGEFCANHRTALELFKTCMTSRDQSFAEWYKHCLANPLLKKKGIPECILFVTQRLTKYPLLIEPLLKSAKDDKLETDKLQHALSLVKALLVDVDACVAEKELRERQIEIYNRVDTKSFAIYKNKPFRKTDLGVESRRRLKFEGLATLMQGRSKMQVVLVVVLTDCLCFLSENSAHNKYTFFTPEHKAGVVPLQKLLIREKAGTESRGIYIISSNPAFPEMYELKVQQPKDKNVWIQSIRQAVLECPSTDVIEAVDLTAEEKLRIGVNKREIIEKMRQKDIEQALLLEEKIMLQLNLLKEHKSFSNNTINTNSTTTTGVTGENGGSLVESNNTVSAASFLATFGFSYKDLVTNECDTAELWKRVLNIVQDIGQLASTVYTAATGLPVSRSVSSVGEKQSDHYASPTLPKRAETFAGFDDKRVKNIFPCRDVVATKAAATMQVMSPRLQELEEKREPKLSTAAGGGIGGGLSSTSLIAALLQSSQSGYAHHPPQSEQQHIAAIAPLISGAADTQAFKDSNYAALQISHHLHTLLCIISQQMTTIHSLQLQLALYRENPRSSSAYTHNDQLEELRNLQDKLQEEKTAWQRQREQQEQDLDDRQTQLIKLQEQIKAEQEDIKQQREQLYRKMEILSNQGLLLSPNTPLMLTSPPITQLPISSTGNDEQQQQHDSHDTGTFSSSCSVLNDTIISPLSCNSTGGGGGNTVDRRKDKWRTASTISKTPPVNLLSATNAPKMNPTAVKQKIPIKLSSLSSTSTAPSSSTSQSSSSSKIDKSASFNSNSITAAAAAAAVSSSTGLTQMFPLKLVDKRTTISTPPTQQQQHQQNNPSIVPQHSRTGSSPAIIQHPTTSPTTTSVTRTDSSSTFTFGQRYQGGSSTPKSSKSRSTNASSLSALASTSKISNSSSNASTKAKSNNRKRNNEEEEIYF